MSEDRPARPSVFAIRAAVTPDERRAAFRLRYRVFIEELHREIPGADAETGIEEPSDAHATILVGYDGETPVGTVTINALADGPVTDEWMAHCRIDDFLPAFGPEASVIVHKALVLRDYRASRLFPMLVEEVVRTAPASTKFCFIGCSPFLVTFYEQLGFRRYAPWYVRGGGELISVPMCLVTGDLEYLRRMRCRLLPVLSARFPEDLEAAAFFRTRSAADRPDPEAARLDWSMDGAPERRDAASLDLLKGLSRDDLRFVLESCERMRVPRKSTLIATGAGGDDMFLVLDGYLEVSAERDGRKMPIATLGPGSLTGEMSMLTGRPRSATLTMLTGGEVLRLPADVIRQISDERPQAAIVIFRNLARILAERVRVTSYWLTESPPL
ncbi:MAG: cyclic nucleotide-binding domain-containing protein [Vicinamibacterales bacterium]